MPVIFFFYIPLFLFRSLFLSSFFTRLCQDCSMSIISWRSAGARMPRNDVTFDSRAAVSRDVARYKYMNMDLEKVLVALVYIFARLCNVCQTNFSEKGKTETTAVFESLATVRLARNLVVRASYHEMIGTRPCQFCVTLISSLSFPPSFSSFSFLPMHTRIQYNARILNVPRFNIGTSKVVILFFSCKCYCKEFYIHLASQHLSYTITIIAVFSFLSSDIDGLYTLWQK